MEEDRRITVVSDLLVSWGLPADVVDRFRDELVDEVTLMHLSQSDLKELIPLFGPRKLLQIKLEEYKRAQGKCVSTTSSEDNLSVSIVKGLDLETPIIVRDGEEVTDVEVTDLRQETSTSSRTESDSSSPPPKRLKTSDVTVKEVTIRNAIDLKAYLHNNPSTKKIATKYTLGEPLRESDRNDLADAIIKNEVCENISKKVPLERLKFLAECLCEVFTSEDKEHYCRIHKYPNGKTIGKGKFYSKYYNIRRGLIQLRLIDPPPGRTVDETLNNDDNDDSVKECLEWLENSKYPWERVRDFWVKTFTARYANLVKNDKESVRAYTDKYPALRDTAGYTLFELDFDQLYKESSLKLFGDWAKLLKFIDDKLTAAGRGSLFEEFQSEGAVRTCLLLKNFCRVFPVITAFRKSAKNQWRPSRIESQEAFILELKSISDIKPYIDVRRNKLSQYGLTVQPQVIIITTSESPDDVQYYASCDNLIYEVDSLLKAVDVTFKIFFATQAQYPPEARQIWEFLQVAVYGIRTKHDTFSSAVTSLIKEYQSSTDPDAA